MPAIGYVTKTETGFKGQLRTISVRADIEIVANRSKTNDKQPDYRVFAGGSEVGGAWIKTGERSGNDYVSLSMAAPEFGSKTIYANLGRAAGQDDEDSFAILWNPED
ncbi:MAG: hypothetical protein JWN66_4328 [Sphingomonas bacterium]|jgi:uncharacterized protein (DUF736 family)|uniref:DUF736 domain-containing protein n=1 Tax=Sphingomonas bacterium TaxID=1895847 RepID=UPI002607CCDF|nr:DUF736 domain-containing protein [Sphingomonas bacterium]MDB5707212.1 hypothetical protein [Sphingomonas bacterium]